MDELFLLDCRCKKCGKLLLRGIFFEGKLEIKCNKCGEINKMGGIHLEKDETHYALIINDKGTITNISESASRILGYSNEELMGEHFTKIDHTMSLEVGRKFLGPEAILKEKNFLRLDTIHRNKEGEDLPVNMYLKLYKSANGEIYILLVMELKNTTKGNNLLQIKSSEFSDNFCDFFMEIDKDGIVISVSQSVPEVFNCEQNECVGRDFFEFFATDKKEYQKNLFLNFSGKFLPYRSEGKIIKIGNNKIVNAELYFTPNFNDFGVFIGYRILGWLIL